MYKNCSVVFLFYASFEDPRAPSVAFLISPTTPVEHKCLLERKTRIILLLGGIGAGLRGEVQSFMKLYLLLKETT